MLGASRHPSSPVYSSVRETADQARDAGRVRDSRCIFGPHNNSAPSVGGRLTGLRCEARLGEGVAVASRSCMEKALSPDRQGMHKLYSNCRTQRHRDIRQAFPLWIIQPGHANGVGGPPLLQEVVIPKDSAIAKAQPQGMRWTPDNNRSAAHPPGSRTLRIGPFRLARAADTHSLRQTLNADHSQIFLRISTASSLCAQSTTQPVCPILRTETIECKTIRRPR